MFGKMGYATHNNAPHKPLSHKCKKFKAMVNNGEVPSKIQIFNTKLKCCRCKKPYVIVSAQAQDGSDRACAIFQPTAMMVRNERAYCPICMKDIFYGVHTDARAQRVRMQYSYMPSGYSGRSLSRRHRRRARRRMDRSTAYSSRGVRGYISEPDDQPVAVSRQ